MKIVSKSIGLFLSICLVLSSLTGVSFTAFAANETVTVEITSFNRGPQADLRSSELLAATVTGYSGNAHDLTYKWTSTLGTYLYVYNSHNMYGINNTDGEIEIYNKNVSSSDNMAGRSYKDSFTGKGYGWAAIYGANLSNSDLVGTVTVEVYDDAGNLLATDSHTGTRVQSGTILGFIPTYKYVGFVASDLKDDISNIAFGLFEGDTKHINDLLGESAMVHVTCAECDVPNASVKSGGDYIKVVSSDGDFSIHGVKKGSGTVSITVEKSNCKFHQNVSATTDVTVHVYKKPTTTSTATAIMLGNLDDDCTYYINHTTGVRTTDEKGNEIVLFEGLSPNTEYQIGVKGEIEGSIPAYAFVYETTKPAHTGTVEVILNGSYDMQTGTATGTRVQIGDVMEGVDSLYLRYEDSEIYFPLTMSETGIYSAVLSDGNYTIYSNDNSASKISEQTLSIAGASRTRELFFNSVTYDLAGGTGGPDKLTEYYQSESTVNATNNIPTKEGYLFTHWTDADGNIYKSGDLITSAIAAPYTLTANYIEAMDVYVRIKLNHISESGDEHNNDKGMHDVTFTVDHRAVGDTEYTQIMAKTIDWDGVSEFNYAGYSAEYNKNDNTEYTLYRASAPVLTNVEKGREYTVTSAKTGYEITSISQYYDENGDLHLIAELTFDPSTFDLEYTVELDEEAKKVKDELKPVAVNVKITAWHDTPYDEDYSQPEGDETVDWYTISQHRYVYERIALGADGAGIGKYPVWLATTDGYSPYYYRIEVISYELHDGSIIKASNVDDANVTYVTDDERYWANIEVTGGAYPISGDENTLTGAWYDKTASMQKGSIKAVISIEVFDVSLNPNGGMLNSSTSTTVLEGQIDVPDLSAYIPTRDDGYVFDGWYYADENGNITDRVASSGDVIQSDVALIAKWKEPLTINGTVTVAGTYVLFDEETGMPSICEIFEGERAKAVTIALQKIDANGYPETVKSIVVPITYDEASGTGAYEFTAVPDTGNSYRIKSLLNNYETKYQNELSESIEVDDLAAYDDLHYTAELNGDKTAVVNTYLQFSPTTFNLEYTIDATAITEDFRPDFVETLILYNDNVSGSNPQSWPPISQMTSGSGYNGQSVAIDGGKGTDSFAVWPLKTDGITPYDYAIRVKSLTRDGEKTEFVESEAPFRITYNGHARFSDLHGQTQELIALLVPRMYTITFDLGDLGGDTITNMDEYLDLEGKFTDYYYWSRGKAISATPIREGYKFLGWQDADGNIITGIDPAMHENVTLYPAWSEINADFETLTDAGYYSAEPDSSDKEGVISLNARLTNFEEIKDSVEEFGIYIYNSAQAAFKATAKSFDKETLAADNGEFHAIISDIASGNFDKVVAAAAYVVIDGYTIISDIMQTSVSAINKWLGGNNPY